METSRFRDARCIAVDINGTLVEGYSYTAWEDVLEKGLKLTRREDSNPQLSWFRALIGLISFEEMVAEAYDVHGMSDVKARAYAIYMKDLKLREGCLDFLGSLRKRYELVVCSDTSGVTKTISKKFGLERYFSRLFYSCDMGCVKSDISFWEIFLSSFPKMKPEDFVMIGDNPKADVHWPKTLGMDTILIESTELPPGKEWAGGNEADEPHVRVKMLGDISRLLLC